MFEHRSADFEMHPYLVRAVEVHLHRDGGTKASSLCDLDVIDRAVVSLKWYGATAKGGSVDYSKIRKILLCRISRLLPSIRHNLCIFEQTSRCSDEGNAGATSGP
jgi:hypothetical protein